ncbi:MAG: hypothetical protein H6819_09095 [Phycisphaerales bacterium]|nr:hypothetical protein [Phycisphaerales bacterium]MCB9856016.1 hypothetical protein [Phycisphaerales bacterium]
MRSLKSKSSMALLIAILPLASACHHNSDREEETHIASSQPATSSVSDSRTGLERQNEASSRYIEAELKDWRPPDGLQPPPATIRVSSIDLEGSWLGRTGMDTASMVISRRNDGTFDVNFSTSGCLGGWRLKRTATYKDGILELDRPVQEYCPITFRRLYTIRANGTELLLPETSVADLMQDRDADGNFNPGSIGIRFYTYGRREQRMRSRNPYLNVIDPNPTDD